MREREAEPKSVMGGRWVQNFMPGIYFWAASCTELCLGYFHFSSNDWAFSIGFGTKSGKMAFPRAKAECGKGSNVHVLNEWQSEEWPGQGQMQTER